MDTDKTDNPIKEVLDGLFALLETLEAQNIAVLEFLKDQGIATDEKLAPYLDRAGSASSVKWRAARARMAYLLAPAPKKATDQKEQPAEKQPEGQGAEPKEAVSKNDGSKEDKGSQGDSPSDAHHKGTVTKDAATKSDAKSEPEPKDAEKKPSETKKPDAMVSETKSASPKETERKTEKVKSEEHGSGPASGRDRTKPDNTDSQQNAGASKQDTNSKAATAGQADESDPARRPNSQDAPVQSRKAK